MLYILLFLLVVFLITFGLIIRLLFLKRKYRSLNRKTENSSAETEPADNISSYQQPEALIDKEPTDKRTTELPEKKAAIIEPQAPKKIFTEKNQWPAEKEAEKRETTDSRPNINKAPDPSVKPRQTTGQSGNLIDNFVNEFSQDFQQKIEQSLDDEAKNTISLFQAEMRRVSEDVLHNYKSRFEDEINRLKESYAGFFEKIARENEKIKSELSDLLRQELLKYKDESLGLKDFLTAETQKTLDVWLQDVNEKIAAIYQPLETSVKEKVTEAEKQIEYHKKEKIREIEEKIHQIIEKVIEDVAGKTIDLSTHEELIQQALEKAKREKLFLDNE